MRFFDITHLMDKKVDEMANSVKNETVNDLLTFLNSSYNNNKTETPEWDYSIITEEIPQPPLLSIASNPIILHRNNETFFSFDGRTLFFTKNYSDFYVFTPFAIKEACLYHLSKKTPTGSKCVIITLDSQNKLTYSDIKNHTIHESKVIISRNVLQLVEKNNELYYLSFKKDNYFVNVVVEDNGNLKPKIVLQNLSSKYGIIFFVTSKTIFLYQDRNIVSSSGKKFKMKGDGIYEVSNMLVIYNRIKSGVRFSLCDDNFIIKNEMTIENMNSTIKIVVIDKMLCCRIGNIIYLIKVMPKELIITKEINCPSNLLDFTIRLGDNKRLTLCFLLQTNYPENNLLGNLSVKEEIKSEIFDVDYKKLVDEVKEDDLSSSKDKILEMTTPKLDSKIYNPFCCDSTTKCDDDVLKSTTNVDSKQNSNVKDKISSFATKGNNLNMFDINSYKKEKTDLNLGLKNSFMPFSASENNLFKDKSLNLSKSMIEDFTSALFEKFEKRLEERDKILQANNLEMFQAFSDKINLTIKDSVKQEIAEVERKITTLLSEKSGSQSFKKVNEEKILNFIKEIICDNLLPIVEASMDEMRIQVLSTVSEFKEPEYLSEVRSALSNLSFYNDISEIERYVKSGNLDKSVECVIKGTIKDLEKFSRLVDFQQLESVSSKSLMGLLEKCILFSSVDYKDFFDDLVYSALTFIEPDNLTDDELRTLIIVLSQIKESDIFLSQCKKPIFVLVDFLNFKIPKILFKRQIALKN